MIHFFHKAWKGQFCTDDVNGDIPTPGIGTECPPCPT